jgi:hypothetical protein
MTPHKAVAVQTASGRNDGERLKDEVYRQMFRLESRRPGADRDLAVALVRACAASYAMPRVTADLAWLRKICPICLAMIEAAMQGAELRATTDEQVDAEHRKTQLPGTI